MATAATEADVVEAAEVATGVARSLCVGDVGSGGSEASALCAVAIDSCDRTGVVRGVDWALLLAAIVVVAGAVAVCGCLSADFRACLWIDVDAIDGDKDEDCCCCRCC